MPNSLLGTPFATGIARQIHIEHPQRRGLREKEKEHRTRPACCRIQVARQVNEAAGYRPKREARKEASRRPGQGQHMGDLLWVQIAPRAGSSS